MDWLSCIWRHVISMVYWYVPCPLGFVPVYNLVWKPCLQPRLVDIPEKMVTEYYRIISMHLLCIIQYKYNIDVYIATICSQARITVVERQCFCFDQRHWVWDNTEATIYVFRMRVNTAPLVMPEDSSLFLGNSLSREQTLSGSPLLKTVGLKTITNKPNFWSSNISAPGLHHLPFNILMHYSYVTSILHYINQVSPD